MFECGMCMVSPGSDGYQGPQEDVLSHLLEDHNIMEDSLDTYMMDRTTEQTTLTEVVEA